MGILVREKTVKSTSAPPVELPSPSAERIAWEYIVVQATVIWLVTRLALVCFTFFSTILTYRTGTSRGSLLAAWYRWDAINYVNIAEQGYTIPKDAAFFPLYPMLIHGGEWLFGNPEFVAMVISNLGTLAACIGLALLSIHEGGDEHTARLSVLALLCWPLGFFLAAAYTEGIFLAFAVWSLWCMRRGRLHVKYWYLAALFAFLATLCRSTGAILFLPLLYEFARQHGWVEQLRARTYRFPFDKGDILPLVATILAVPLALASFSVFCLMRYGDMLMWVHIQIQWGRVSVPIWQSIWGAVTYHLSFLPLSYFQGHALIDTLPFLVVIVVTIIGARRMPLAYTLYSVGLIVLVLSSPRVVDGNMIYLMSAGRFALAALPAFLLIGRWSQHFPSAASFFLYGGVLLQGAFLAFFLMGGLLI
jgi:Dolichyl-phosphate-mannose-protein mannosyltransferase